MFEGCLYGQYNLYMFEDGWTGGSLGGKIIFLTI